MDERTRKLLTGYVDGELSDAERAEFERALAEHPELQQELEEFRRLKEVTSTVQYADLPSEVWEKYWESLYRKLERGIGWLLFSIGAIVLLLFGGYTAFREMYADPTTPLWVKIGVSGLTAGGIFLLVSYGRERLFANRRERYREVER
ncbi:MAG: hypothetical protein D6800_11790 [Candidatus Zixiibacteriota bacterium]|nr:MAG: hypothetical protein D6800_11790 [candidate division Zixibacteria bacterium]